MRSIITFTCLAFLITGCASKPSAVQNRDMGREMRRIALMQPLADDARYLGIPDGDTFTLDQVDADILIVQFFSMYCPKCQVDAEHTNELFALINNETADVTIKMVGIGFANTDFEIAIFKKKFNIAFPLFPDMYGKLARELKVSSTPYYLAIKRMENKQFKVIYQQEDKLEDPGKFLEAVLNNVD
jgi:peroxiredoxin